MSDNNSSGGIGFCGLLAIVFIVLKLIGYITWSWWWVTCPLWISIAILLAILLFMLASLIVACIVVGVGIIIAYLKKW